MTMLMGEYDYTLYFVSDQTADDLSEEPPMMAKVTNLFLLQISRYIRSKQSTV